MGDVGKFYGGDRWPDMVAHSSPLHGWNAVALAWRFLCHALRGGLVTVSYERDGCAHLIIGEPLR